MKNSLFSWPNQATESYPKEHMDNLKSMLKEENIHLHTEVIYLLTLLSCLSNKFLIIYFICAKMLFYVM